MLSTGKQTTTKLCPECGNEFVTVKYNKKYCSKICCVKTTNRTLLERYHAGKDQKKHPRQCVDCDTKLSIYNDEIRCSACERKTQDVERVDLLKELGFFDYVQE